jgi:hypothetical protein
MISDRRLMRRLTQATELFTTALFIKNASSTRAGCDQHELKFQRAVLPLLANSIFYFTISSFRSADVAKWQTQRT